MTSWKITLPCTREQAEAAVITNLFDDWEPSPTLTVSEPDGQQPDAWLLALYTDEKPDDALLAAILHIAPNQSDQAPLIEQLVEQDWVTLSQAEMVPIIAGPFGVRTLHYRRDPETRIDLIINAGLAFGTGHHETTRGCLIAIDTLESSGAKFANILDLGTGTGLLAFAAYYLWPQAQITASDIDPVSIRVSTENAAVNAVPLGNGRGMVQHFVADGLQSRALAERAPFDLIIANILAQPLIDLAADIVDALALHGQIILSGLLSTQAAAVRQAFVARGMIGINETIYGDWAVLVMQRTEA